jgi:hypothetical protein
VVYEERPRTPKPKPAVTAAANDTVAVEVDQGQVDGDSHTSEHESATEWHIVTTLPLAHGPYEINHAVWCGRFDGGRKGEEEMIVTTGDDGMVKAWAIEE